MQSCSIREPSWYTLLDIHILQNNQSPELINQSGVCPHRGSLLWKTVRAGCDAQGGVQA
jgi:hypothetical protein